MTTPLFSFQPGNAMSELDNELTQEVPDELTALKARADLMGIKFHPSISLEKLRDKVAATLNGASDEAAPAAQVVAESLNDRRTRKRKEANKLVRIRVSCMNPAKKEWDGELFTAGNSLVGSFSKFVPFNDAEDGWHVPHIILEQIQQRQCQIFVTSKDERGNTTRKGKLIKEFAVEIMPDLTTAELNDLAQRQAMAKSIS